MKTLALLMLCAAATAQDQPWTAARFELHTAKIERRGAERGTAILLDRETGRTWIYIEEVGLETNLINGWLEVDFKSNISEDPRPQIKPKK